MNLSQFFDHWRIVENPFRGEEARHDTVFARMAWGAAPTSEPARTAPPTPAADAPGPESPSTAGEAPPAPGPERPGPHQAGTAAPGGAAHSDFEKILGDITRPSTAIVFGEKGSGKTAIRLQIADRIAAHNTQQPQSKVLLVPYDDLNGMLDRYIRRVPAKTPQDALAKFRLVDHIDAVVGQVVPRLIDSIAGKPPAAKATATAAAAPASPMDAAGVALDLGPEPRKAARRMDASGKRDLLLLQIVYDRSDVADLRTGKLRRILRLGLPSGLILWNALAWLGWLPAAAVFAYAWIERGASGPSTLMTYIFAGLLALWLVILAKRYAWDNLALLGIARKMRRQLRVQGRSEPSLVRSLRQLDPVARDAGHLPLTDSDEARYAMLERLRRTLRTFGYTGLIIVIDRVDEPTLISGDPERMRAVIWPLFNNKFLQQDGVGIKMLLPIELRHALFKESSAFFQEARLDKQNLIERLSWTGAMLYDLCDARLKACREPGAEPVSLLDLFAGDVTGRDLVDALDQMHQPRDAFKFLYACLSEHCSNVTAEQQQWKVPRLVLDSVRKQQSDRVQQLYRGIRPA